MASTKLTLRQMLSIARIKASKEQTDCAREIGVTPQMWGRFENERTLFCPAILKSLHKIATFLNLDFTVLREKVCEAMGFGEGGSAEGKDILPLIRAIAPATGSEVQKVTMQDLLFLLEMESSLDAPMSSALVAELLKNRHDT